MKLKELKHNHSLTDLLKILIFSLLMLAPILSIATRCLYVICNKNAYQSYYGETINEYVDNTPTNFENGQLYHIGIQTENLLTSDIRVYLDGNITNIYYVNIGDTNTNNIQNNCTSFLLLNNSNLNMYISFRDINDSTILNVNLKDREVSFDFTSDTYSGDMTQILSYLTYRVYNKDSYLDNVFEYSVHSLEDNQLFNWTKNTAVYTGVNAMTTNLQIEGSVIPILVTYWFLLTIIYVIIDIVLKLFTILTHMIGNKTA